MKTIDLSGLISYSYVTLNFLFRKCVTRNQIVCTKMNDIYLQLISDIREYSMQLFLVEHIYFSYMQVGLQ